MSQQHATGHILQSLAVNAAIAAAKGVAALFTGSGALVAETLHSAADTINQLLLLLGVRQASSPPDDGHPLGHGRALYFWSFVVALLLFSGGGVFSIYEGIHKLRQPEPLEHVWLGLVILAFSLVLEGASTFANVRELRRRGKGTPFLRYLQQAKDSDLIVVFGENAAATIGLVLALVSLLLAWSTGDTRWDAAGSVAIGLVLVGVSIFLSVKISSLMLGERAESHVLVAARELASGQAGFTGLLEVLAIQHGPGEVLLAAKVRMCDDLSAPQVTQAINSYEGLLRARCPEIRWCFVEPDVRI